MRTADLERGRDALARGAWEEAREAFAAAARQQRSAESLEGLGDACWWLNDAPHVFEAREEAYRLYHERGDRVSAARIALWLYWDYRAFRSDAAVSSGWLHRAERLLEGLESTREYGWLTATRTRDATVRIAFVRLSAAHGLFVYEGGGHGCRWEDPARFAGDLAAFLTSVRAHQE